MKNILLATFLTAIFASGALGQTSFYTFQPNGIQGGSHPPKIYMDSIWQYGVPAKPEFVLPDEYEPMGQYKVCTDTTNYIQDTGRWSICFGLKRDTLTIINNCMDFYGFSSTFSKFCGISDSTGLLIEVSPDSIHWFNLLDYDDMYEYEELTGISTGFSWDNFDSIGILDNERVWMPGDAWVNALGAGIVHAWTLLDAGSVMEGHLRLTYISKTFTPHAGIAFSGLFTLFGIWCEGIGIDEYEGSLDIRLYPNPVTDCSVFEVDKSVVFPVHLTIFNPVGHVLHRQVIYNNNRLPFPRLNITAGVYMYSIVDNSNQYNFGTFIYNP